MTTITVTVEATVTATTTIKVLNGWLIFDPTFLP
jgi:hypothetical protein